MFAPSLFVLLLAVTASSQSIKPLASLRNDLNAFVPAIVNTAVARSSFNASSTHAEQAQVRKLLKQITSLDSASGASVTLNVPAPVFFGNTSVPYVFYDRTQSLAAQYGDSSANTTIDTSLWNLTFSTLAPASTSNVTEDNSDPTSFLVDPAVLTSSLLTLSASRVSIGRAVGLAKLYDASANATDMLSPNSTFCAFLQAGQADKVRLALTDRVQENNVRTSVTSFALQATNSTSEKPSPLVGTVVGLYNFLINVTTDVEVATMFGLYQSGKSGC